MNDDDVKNGDATAPADPTEPITIRHSFQIPEILGNVDYVYSNHARLSSNKTEIRFAFGDIDPTGKLIPGAGIILPHVVAKSFSKALLRVIEEAEKTMGEIIDPTEGTMEVDLGPITPKKAE